MCLEKNKLPKKGVSLSYFIAILLIITSAHAQEIIELDPVTAVSFPVVEESELRSNGRISVVSPTILDTINAQDLTSAIRRIPGVTISRYNPVGAYGGSDGGGVFIRGHGSGRPGADISTLIDGVPLFVGVWTHPLIDTLSIDLAQSVEVFKSPQPIEIGNMGFGAVNLTPRTALGEGLRGELETSYGHHETFQARGIISYQADGLSALVSGSRSQSDGHRENADGRVDALYANVGYAWNDAWSSSFLVSLTDSWAHDPEPVGVTIPITERYETRNRFYLGKIEYLGDDVFGDIKFHYEDGTGDWRQWHIPPPPPFPAQQLETLTQYDNYGIKSRLSKILENDWTLTASLNWDRYGGSVEEDFQRGPLNIFEEIQFELFSPSVGFEKTWQPSGSPDTVKLSGGVRYFDHSVFDGEVAGQLSLIYQKESVEYYVYLAQSYNYPGVYVSVFGRRPPPWRVAEDWRTLEAESIQHAEIGTKWHINQSLTLDFSLFNDQVENAITLVAPPPAGVIFNQGDYQIQGAEALLHYRKENLAMFFGLTLLDSDTERPNTPEWTGIVGLSYERDGWNFSADLQSISEQTVINPRFGAPQQEIDSYQLLNARIAYAFELQNASLIELYLFGENLLNQSYEYRPGYPMPGISLTVGAEWKW